MSESRDPRFLSLYHDALSGRLSRRQVLRRGAALGLSTGAVGVLLAACGGTSTGGTTTAATGTTSTSSGGASGAASTASASTSAASPTTAAVGGGTAKQGGSITIGTLGEASSINPIAGAESEGTWRTQMLFDQLVTVDPSTLKPAPSIAKSWDVNNLTYTFHLRDNVKFSDGTGLTADDIAFTIKAMIDKKNASQYQSYYLSIQGANDYASGTATDVSGIKVVDPMTISLTLANPDAAFIFNLRFVKPIPSKMLQGKDLSKASKDPFWQKPIGAGPFQFVSWTTGGDFVASRNPNYYGAPMPYLDKFTHRVIADSDSLVNALLSGGIDGTIYADPGASKQIQSNSGLNVLTPPFAEVDGWTYSFKNAYLAKKEVRQAVAYALDMTQFAKDSLYDLGKPATGPILPNMYAYDKTLKPTAYDPEKAKSLLQQAGTPPAGIVFATNQGNVLRQDYLTYTQQALAKVGWNITPKLIEWATLVKMSQDKNFDAVTGPVAIYSNLDPSSLYTSYLTDASGNYMGYSNPQLDTLLKQAKQELDIAKQIPLYAQIQQILVEDMPANYSWYRPYIHVVSKKFAGYVVQNVLPEGVFNALQTVYVNG
ncbi:MAG TPA: ABC transporter substrate-binding protein [Thermomicrobiaceae bacterium]|nr:ABC transporter substrate-binding protein [Thermomicrobiaceae bacterium]